MSPPRLAIDNLSVRIGDTDAIRDVSLSIAPGQIFGVAGESGSGKSMMALAVMGLLPDGALRGGDEHARRPRRARSRNTRQER